MIIVLCPGDAMKYFLSIVSDTHEERTSNSTQRLRANDSWRDPSLLNQHESHMSCDFRRCRDISRDRQGKHATSSDVAYHFES
jgi:hypothetical protein